MTSKLSRLESERNELATRLTAVETSLMHQREGWRKEKEKTMALTYSELSLVQTKVIQRQRNCTDLTEERTV